MPRHDLDDLRRRRDPRGDQGAARAGASRRDDEEVVMPMVASARFGPGDVVRHRMFGFRGVVFDIDPVFANSEDWYASIPEAIRPDRDQPFYHLLAENHESTYIAYVSQQNLVGDAGSGPVDHPQIERMFDGRDAAGRYRLRPTLRH